MKTTIQKQSRVDGVDRCTLEHTETGYQIQVTQGPLGFVIHSSQGMTFRRYDQTSWTVEQEKRDET